MKNNTFLALLAIVLVVSVLFGALTVMPSSAAPSLAAPTPVAGINRAANKFWLQSRFVSGAQTADSRVCVESAGYDLMDLQYVLDQGTVNTTTIKIQYTNDQVTFIDGASIVTANAADTSGLLQYPLFGRYTCVNTDVVNANPLTTTVIGILK